MNNRVMESVLFRFGIVWIMLHVILFFIEMFRYKQSNSSWYFLRKMKCFG